MWSRAPRPPVATDAFMPRIIYSPTMRVPYCRSSSTRIQAGGSLNEAVGCQHNHALLPTIETRVLRAPLKCMHNAKQQRCRRECWSHAATDASDYVAGKPTTYMSNYLLMRDSPWVLVVPRWTLRIAHLIAHLAAR